MLTHLAVVFFPLLALVIFLIILVSGFNFVILTTQVFLLFFQQLTWQAKVQEINVKVSEKNRGSSFTSKLSQTRKIQLCSLQLDLFSESLRCADSRH